MLVNIFGSSLMTPTNPPPDANGYPEPPPTDHAHDGGAGQPDYPIGARRHDHPDDAPPPSFNPTPCSPS